VSVDPTVISASRVDKYFQCGVAFKSKYVDERPEVIVGAAALFGSVMHKALEKWALNRSQDLVPLVDSAWAECTEGTYVRTFLDKLQPLAVESRALIEEIQRHRPDVKQVRATKDWKDSDVSRRLHYLIRDNLDKLNERSPWRFSKSDPLPALYDESFVLARRYQERWKHLPPVFVTEFAFTVPWLDWTLRGHIDYVAPLVDKDFGEVIGVEIGDYKTDSRFDAPMKHWRQLTIYDVAWEHLTSSGQVAIPDSFKDLPVYVSVDYLKLLERKHWKIGQEDRKRLRRELEQYSDGVGRGHFPPASKFTDPGFCDLGDLCCLKSCAVAGGGAELVELNV
jgi:hypothetical protein